MAKKINSQNINIKELYFIKSYFLNFYKKYL